MDENKETKEKSEVSAGFRSLDILIQRWKEGTFQEIIDDWKWILTYSARYKGAIAFYLVLGIFSSTLGLVSSVVSKYLIDIITGYRTDKLAVLIAVAVGSALTSLIFNNIIGRITLKLSIDINNDIQADIFDKIISVEGTEEAIVKFEKDWETLGVGKSL